MYECLTGEPPFQAASVMSLIAKLLMQEPRPPVALNPDIPPALSALVLQLLAKRPEQRVQTAADLVDRLAPLG